jgi:hypothetical protein
LSACGGLTEELATSSSSLIPADGELLIDDPMRVADLELPNGSSLHFIEFAAENIAVLEQQQPGVASIARVKELPPDASLADVFFAFSEPGTEIPAQILAVSNLSGDYGAQGWARDLVNETISGRGNCTDSEFSDAVTSFGYNDRGTPDLRLNKIPESSGYFEAYDYIPGDGNSYDFFRYTVGGNDASVWYDVDRYYSRVAVCAIDQIADGNTSNPGGLAHPPISYQGYSNGHMGPVVAMGYRRPGEAVWNWPAVKDFAANEVGLTLSWHFYTGLNWDWQTKIYWAGGDDSFDIGHAVEDI